MSGERIDAITRRRVNERCRYAGDPRHRERNEIETYPMTSEPIPITVRLAGRPTVVHRVQINDDYASRSQIHSWRTPISATILNTYDKL
jgi:hypothetical protein